MTTRIRASLLALPLLLPSFQAIAALPGMNLGQTSFLDGKALPGTLFQQFVNIYEADDFMDANGHRRPLDNRLRTLLATSHFAHISQHQLFGAYYGAEILVPVLLADPDFEPHAGSANGLGNLIVSPFILQWPQTELFGRPYWQRLNLAFQLPTGRYDRHRAINPGSNHWSFNPHYALTWEFAEGWGALACSTCCRARIATRRRRWPTTTCNRARRSTPTTRYRWRWMRIGGSGCPATACDRSPTSGSTATTARTPASGSMPSARR